MYQYARACTEDDLKERITTIDGDVTGTALELDVMLAESMRSVRFVGAHLFDLKVIVDGVVLTQE